MLDTKLHHLNDKTNYLIDVNFLQIGFPQIVLIFDNIDYEPLKEDVHKLSMLSEFVDAEYGDDNKEISLYFDVPSKFKKDFELFVSGLYSKFSDEFKEVLVKKYGNYRETGVSELSGLPNVSLYDTIYPLKTTKKLLADQLKVEVKLINEVLDPPSLKEEEYKSVEELINEK